MPDEIDSSPQLVDLSEEELAELVRGIDRRHIVRLVKQDKHLQRRVFAGFRPTHLPWDRVPSRLAQDALGDPGKAAYLLDLWIASNQDLLGEVSDVPAEDLREGMINLLVRRGLENRTQILWALRVDERPEVAKALEDGLERELSEEVSVLVRQAESTILTEALESAREHLAEAEAERDAAHAEVGKLQRLAQHRAGEAQDLRDSYEEAVAGQAWLKDEIKTLKAEIKVLKEQRRSDEGVIGDLKRQLADEEERVQELRRSVRDLKSTLQAQSEDRDLDDALLELEEERQNSARLRLKVEGLTQDLREAYDKRDQVREQVESLEDQVRQLKHDKEVIIEEKRHLHRRVENLRTEVKDLRTQRDEQAYERALAALPVEDLQSLWQGARRDIRDHVHSVVSVLRADEQQQTLLSKSSLWSKLMERESSLVEAVLAHLDAYSETGSAPDVSTLVTAQELLALRWYLLEYTRQAIEYAELTSFPV